MKTAEELKALKEEVETLNEKLAELTKDELAQVSGGLLLPIFRGNLNPDFEDPCPQGRRD